MADFKKKTPSVLIVLPAGVAAHCYIDKPDDKAPEGSKFAPDGKYKTKVVFDDEAPLADLTKAVKAGAKAEWGSDVDFDEFKFPYTSHDDDAKSEGFRGKTVLAAKSKFQPKVSYAKQADAEKAAKVFGGDIIRIAVTLYFYEKTEAVKVGKKIEQVKMRGCSAQLAAVKLMEKRAMGGGAGGDPFGDEESYEAASTPTTTAHSGAEDDGDF